MPALTIATSKASSNHGRGWLEVGSPDGHPSISSSSRPSVSPVTSEGPARTAVTSSYSVNATSDGSPSTLVSESQNPDAIALRSAISILRMQRDRSLLDLQTLERQKRQAVAEPEHFRRQLTAGRIHSGVGSKALLGSEWGNVTPAPSLNKHRQEQSDEEGDQDDEEEEEEEDDEEDGSVMEIDREEAQRGNADDPLRPSTFGPIPTPQNIVRCPPINWAKYHVVGKPLEKLHEEQRSRPSPGIPHQDEVRSQVADGAAEAVIAAPYRPFVDKVPEPMRTRSGGKRG